MDKDDFAHKPARRWTRRRFLAATAASLAAVAGATGLYTWQVEPFWFEVVQRTMAIANLPAPLNGARLIQLSDLHVGRTDPEYLAGALRFVETLRPDLLVITGDFMSGFGVPAAERAGRMLRNLKPAPLGSFACLGNHDYGSAWRNVACAETIARVCSDAGIQVLRDECATVSGLRVAGVDDLWCPRFDGNAVTRMLTTTDPHVVLCHNPDMCDLPIWADFRGWILAGHTHGGQCKPPFLPPPMLPVRNLNYIAGEYELPGGRRLYINRALGYLRQVRFNVRPEITVFTLRNA